MHAAVHPIIDDQVAFYREHGYLLIEGLIPPAVVHALLCVMRTLIEASKDLSASDARYDLGPGHSRERLRVRRIKDPEQQDPAFARLSRSREILEVVQRLIGPAIRFDHAKLNLKPPRTEGSVIAWHQDWAFYPHTNDDLLAIGVMLEDCGPSNGPLMVIPGSHRGPVHDHHDEGRFIGMIDTERSSLDESKAVALTGRAGSVTVHHVRTVHGSSENLGPGERPLLLLSYAAVDAWPIEKRVDLDEFNSRILSGAPTLAPRMEALPIRLSRPRDPSHGSIYDNQAIRMRSRRTL